MSVWQVEDLNRRVMSDGLRGFSVILGLCVFTSV